MSSYIRNNINPSLKGSGVRLAVIDTGIDHHHPYLPRPIYELDVRDNWPDDNYAEDEEGHGTLVVGIITNNYSSPSGYEGVAPDIELAVLKATGCPGPGSPSSCTPLGDVNQQIYDAMDHAANDTGAQIISMSLGTKNGNDFILNSDGTSIWEQKADWATRNGTMFINAAGNEGQYHGYYSIVNPATAKNVIAVGATNHWYHEETNVTVKNTYADEDIDDLAYYSSRGDTGDNGSEHGRDKPEVVAPGGAWNTDCTDDRGDGIVSARGKTDDQSSYLPLVNGSCSYKNNDLYRRTGTSMAAPHVSGIAALIIDNYNFAKSDRNAAMVKAMIVGSGINIGDNDRIANHTENHVDDDIGYGKVDLYQAIGYNGSTRKNWYFGDSLNTSGSVANYTFTVPSDNTYHYIKATVVWNDPPTTTTDPNWGALKNDIDIELRDPSGTLIESSNSWQQNIEQINYYNPSGITSGDWKLQVKAESHWDSTQEFGGFINLYTDKPSVNVRAFSNKSNVSTGDKIQITATVNNTGGEVASGVIVSLNLTSPPGSSIEDNFTIDSGYGMTLLGNIPPLGSRTVSWNLTVKNTIPETTFHINATYSNIGSATNGTVTLNGNSISGWDYRKQKNITGSTAGAQTNYQMKLTVYNSTGTDTPGNIYLGGNAKSDFSDLRFTKSDGITLLDYWIESYTPGVNATVWVEVDSIPASPNTASIYLYYGNSFASSSSNIHNTFLFGDDFEDNSWTANNWNLFAGGYTLVSATQRDGSTGKVLKSNNNSGQTHIIANVAADNIVIEANVKPLYDAGGTINYGVTFRDSSNLNTVNYFKLEYLNWGPAGHNLHYVGCAPETRLTGTGWTINNWYMLQAQISGSSLVMKLYDRNGNLMQTIPKTASCSLTNTWLGIYSGDYSGNTAYYDAFRVRKYASPEPAWGS
ncbi:MAG: DUF2341 domain-containing protein [Candidatus Methanoperedens sp.]|nr:DUF2341 domain-containing protein [Candidatus Methanoperedens sp.]